MEDVRMYLTSGVYTIKYVWIWDIKIFRLSSELYLSIKNFPIEFTRSKKNLKIGFSSQSETQASIIYISRYSYLYFMKNKIKIIKIENTIKYETMR